MAERSARVFLWLSGALLLGIGVQAAFIAWGGDPLAGVLEPAAEAEPAAGPAEKPGDKPPPLPERFKAVDSSGIFGRAPQKEVKPTLLGIAANHAFLLAPDGQSGLVAEGGELGGMKLLRIATNRVLIEYQGKEQELTMFSGFGSEPLLPKGKEKKP